MKASTLKAISDQVEAQRWAAEVTAAYPTLFADLEAQAKIGGGGVRVDQADGMPERIKDCLHWLGYRTLDKTEGEEKIAKGLSGLFASMTTRPPAKVMGTYVVFDGILT